MTFDRFKFIYLEWTKNVELKDEFLNSNGPDGLCYIDLPLNSDQAATLFEWKLRIIKIGCKEERYSHDRYTDRGYVRETRTRQIENDIKIGFSNLQQGVWLSSKSGSIQLTGSGDSTEAALKRPECSGPTVKQADILSFQFDCRTGTFFVQKNDECRILIGYINDSKYLKKTFYPCVQFANGGDTIEILTAAPIYNSIHATPIAISKSYLSIISTLYLYSLSIKSAFCLFFIKTKSYMKSLRTNGLPTSVKFTIFIVIFAIFIAYLFGFI